MLDMAEFIRKTEPERSDILIRAINNSKENGVFRDMEDLVKLLASTDQLGDAVDQQGEVVDELQSLLELLMSDDREKELAEERARIEQYIKDLTKIIAGQKDVRAATDRDDPSQGLTPRQQKLAEKTAELKKLIEEQDKQAKAKAESENKPQDPNKESPSAPKEDAEKDPSNENSDQGKPNKSEDGKPVDPKNETTLNILIEKGVARSSISEKIQKSRLFSFSVTISFPITMKAAAERRNTPIRTGLE